MAPLPSLGTILQVNVMNLENDQLRDYITQLERSHLTLSRELMTWQGRWKATAANNVKLCRQLHRTAAGCAPPAAQHRLEPLHDGLGPSYPSAPLPDGVRSGPHQLHIPL